MDFQDPHDGRFDGWADVVMRAIYWAVGLDNGGVDFWRHAWSDLFAVGD